jgi:hypothetical protein
MVRTVVNALDFLRGQDHSFDPWFALKFLKSARVFDRRPSLAYAAAG